MGYTRTELREVRLKNHGPDMLRCDCGERVCTVGEVDSRLSGGLSPNHFRILDIVKVQGVPFVEAAPCGEGDVRYYHSLQNDVAFFRYLNEEPRSW